MEVVGGPEEYLTMESFHKCYYYFGAESSKRRL